MSGHAATREGRMVTIEELTEKVDADDGITGEKMAGYLRQIADALEPSEKLFTAKLKITVIGAGTHSG